MEILTAYCPTTHQNACEYLTRKFGMVNYDYDIAPNGDYLVVHKCNRHIVAKVSCKVG